MGLTPRLGYVQSRCLPGLRRGGLSDSFGETFSKGGHCPVGISEQRFPNLQSQLLAGWHR